MSPSDPNAGVHAREAALTGSASHEGLVPSIALHRVRLPRVDTNRDLAFGWRLRRNRDRPPVATLMLGHHLVVLAGELVPLDDPAGDDVRPVFTPYLLDPVLQVDGQTRYDPFGGFFRPDMDGWDVADGVLWTSFDLQHSSGPYRVTRGRTGNYLLSCDTCNWRGGGRRSATVMPMRLAGDMLKHTCGARTHRASSRA